MAPIESPGRAQRTALAILAVTAIGLYLPALPGPLLLDDRYIIQPLLDAVTHGDSLWLYLFSESGPFGRPLAMASFILNATFSGADLRYWKATSLAIHLLNGGLVYLTTVTLALLAATPARAARALGLATAALWLLHPLHVSTVMYLSQRMTALSTLFALAAMLLYARGRRAGADTRGGALQIVAALLLATPLAVLCKETGVLTPYYLLLLELTVGSALRARPRWLIGAFVVTAGLPVLAAGVHFALHWQHAFLDPYTLREFTPFERIATQWRILLIYLGWLLVPRRSAFGFYHDDVAVAGWPPDLLTVAAGLTLLALVVTAWRGRRRAPLASFGVLLFFCGHALESSAFGLELMFEHRNYLPAVGICLALAAGASALLGRRQWWVLGPTLLLFALVTWSLTTCWGDAPRLYASFLADHPHSLRARETVVEGLLAGGEFARARRTLNSSEHLSLRLQAVRIDCLERRQADATATLTTVAAAPLIDGFAGEVLLWLAARALDGSCALDQAALAAAFDHQRQRPMSTPTRVRFHIYAALLLQQQGDYAAAARALEQVVTLAPADPYPHYLAAEIAVFAGRPAQAREHLAVARQLAGSARPAFAAIDQGVEALLSAP